MFVLWHYHNRSVGLVGTTLDDTSPAVAEIIVCERMHEKSAGSLMHIFFRFAALS